MRNTWSEVLFGVLIEDRQKDSCFSLDVSLWKRGISACHNPNLVYTCFVMCQDSTGEYRERENFAVAMP